MEYKYFAFISYSSKDLKWGKRLQRKLESYKMPATLCSDRGWQRRPMQPIFFAPSDIQPGGLDNELKARLEASRHLIVVCSPNSAQSKWVGREIEYFHQLGRTANIHFFIIDGLPHSGNRATECINPIVGELGIPEILGANIHEKVSPWWFVNRERAYVQLITKLLGVEFDSIWNRHRRMMRHRVATWIVGLVAVVSMVISTWHHYHSVQVGLRLRIVEDNAALPPLRDAVVSLLLNDETKRDTIATIDGCARFVNIPHRYIGSSVRITFACPDFIAKNTVVRFEKDIELPVERDVNVYGRVKFRLWDINREQPVANRQVVLNGDTLCSDSAGNVRTDIPLSRQLTIYPVTIGSKTDSLYMPCGDYENIIVE